MYISFVRNRYLFTLMSFSKLEPLLIHVQYSKNRKWPLRKSFSRLYKRITFVRQMLWFLRIKNRFSKSMRQSVCKSLIGFNESLILYRAGLMYIAYGLLVLFQKNIKTTTLTIGYITFIGALSDSMWRRRGADLSDNFN